MSNLKVFEVTLTDTQGLERILYVSALDKALARQEAEWLLFISYARFVDSYISVAVIKELN